ncbi:hypothetical protein BDW62DRAFT_82980 [Aspergillus aurantiobrunneus]
MPISDGPSQACSGSLRFLPCRRQERENTPRRRQEVQARDVVRPTRKNSALGHEQREQRRVGGGQAVSCFLWPAASSQSRDRLLPRGCSQARDTNSPSHLQELPETHHLPPPSFVDRSNFRPQCSRSALIIIRVPWLPRRFPTTSPPCCFRCREYRTCLVPCQSLSVARKNFSSLPS